jgi:beta-glucosidase
MPADFVWGAATASYQIEGAWEADGKGPSVWDVFSSKPGNVWEDQTGRIACDHYHRYPQDVALMKEIGLNAYRFSFSWSRILPEGTGGVNEKGLEFYDRLVDELLAAAIEPWATLFHWDYPQALYLRGGWLNPDSSQWFADYARVIVERFSDRISHWMTINEPQCFVGMGHYGASYHHAPGDQLGISGLLQAAHHVLLAHGRAVQVIRGAAKTTPRIGWAPVGVVSSPISDSAEDIKAARSAMFSPEFPTWNPLWNNVWWADPVVFGSYPEPALLVLGQHAPRYTDAEMKVISEPLDFYGANIYNGQSYRAGADGKPEKMERPPGYPHTLNHWKMTPDCLYWGPRFLWERYGLPIAITENGLSCHDWVSLDGGVHDPQRIDFLTRYLRELQRATADGVPVLGYFHWSLLDNFEWSEGYKHRFGLIHVDYETQKRTLKDSAHWYHEVIRTNGASLG